MTVFKKKICGRKLNFFVMLALILLVVPFVESNGEGEESIFDPVNVGDYVYRLADLTACPEMQSAVNGEDNKLTGALRRENLLNVIR